MGRRKKSRKQSRSSCEANRVVPPRDCNETEKLSPDWTPGTNSFKNENSAQEPSIGMMEYQDSKETAKDFIEMLENENKRLNECIKTQRKEMKDMENEIKMLQFKNNTQSKDIEKLLETVEKQNIIETSNEEVIKVILQESDMKDDCVRSLIETINSITQDCSSHEASKLSLQETLNIILIDNEDLLSKVEVLNEELKKSEEDLERERESLNCIICTQRACKIVFSPCGHLITCSDCSIGMNQCPLCRQSIISRVSIYRS